MSYNKLLKLRDYLNKTHQGVEADVKDIDILLNHWYYASGSLREQEATLYLEKYAFLKERIETMEVEIENIVAQLKALKVTKKYFVKRKEYLLDQILEFSTFVAIPELLIKEIKKFINTVQED